MPLWRESGAAASLGLGVRTELASREPGGLRRRAIAFRIALISVVVIPSAANAQNYTWGGTGSTTTTTDYNTGTNWSNQAAVPPPISAGQSAIFDATGSVPVVVTGGPISPDNWTFNANSKSFLISGADVNFSVTGASGGIIDRANSGQSIEIFNNINGPGVQVQLLGNSALTLFGTNTYSGGTTVSGFGTLSVVSDRAAGTGVVTLENGGFQAAAPNLLIANNFVINPTAAGSAIGTAGFSAAFTGNISGAGKLTIISFGFGPFTAKVILDGTNTYTGGTTICSCAAVQLGDATHFASLVGDVTVFGTLEIINANTAGITKITNDFEAGAFFAGQTSFRNATSAGTMTIINKNGGETDFFNNSTAANATIVNRSGGLTTFNNMATAASARITNRFGGETDFYDRSTAASATITNRYGGLTTFNDRSTAGNADITNRFGGQLFFFDRSSAGNATINNGSFGTFSSAIPEGVFFAGRSTAGNATINNNNNGAIAFGFPFFISGFNPFDRPTAGNATITNNAGSSLEFNALSTAGNATIVTNSGAAVGFFDASTGGNAQFITNGSGYVDFSGTIGRRFNGVVTAGSIAGSGTYYLGDNRLVVGSNNLSTEVSGVIADGAPCGCPGFGSLVKIGSGQLTLSGLNAYSGPTFVDGGFLDVEGSISSSIFTRVNSGGALTGAGIVGNTFIANGGIFLPGSGFGTFMSVQGNLAFQSGALYLVQLSSATSTFADVSGTAHLNGNVGVAIDPAGTVMKQYMILQASGGVSGTFSGLAAPLPGGLVATLSYDPTHAYINFDLNYGAKNNLNVNQTNVGNALTNFFNSNGGIPAVFASLSPAGLTQASGELATGTQQATFNAMNLFLSLLTDPFVSGRGSNVTAGGSAQPYAEEDGSLAYAAKRSGGAGDALARMPTKAGAARNDLLDSRWSVWGSAFGGGADISGNAALGSNSANVRAFGFAAGADYRISPATLAGFALAGGGTNFSVTGSGFGRSDMFQAGAFVRHTVGAAYVTGALAYGGQDVTTDRTVTIAGVDHLRAQFNSNAWSGRLEGGYRYATPWMGITPYAAAQFTTLDLPAYAEQVISGSGMFALNYNARSVTDPRSELGVRTDRSFAMSNGILTLRGRLAWAHDYYTDRDITPVFQSLPGAFFVVNGAAQAHDSALTTASAEMRWLNGWSAAVTFEGEFSDVMNSYAGKAVARYAW